MRQHPPESLPSLQFHGKRQTRPAIKNVNFTATGDREIQLYRCLSIAPDDVLVWWKSQKVIYPWLLLLAKTLLVIPATSAPSERVFSTVGLMVNAKRNSFAPSTVIHENAHFVYVIFE